MRRFIGITLLCVMILTLSIGLAEEITPYADSVFHNATISLSARKDASFVGITYYKQKKITVTACSLEKKTGTDSWMQVKILPLPKIYARIPTHIIQWSVIPLRSVSVLTELRLPLMQMVIPLLDILTSKPLIK